jgi:pimeloyl-ACP methyl ester carboxylesterase
VSSVKRAYVDGPWGQIHVRLAGPEAPTRPGVVMFHQSPNSSQIFRTFQPLLASDRCVVAPDTPGFGNSDPCTETPDIPDYADALAAVLPLAGDGPIDLIGYHTGAMIACEFARRMPGIIRRLVLVGIPLFNDAERDGFALQPWPKPEAPDGSHIIAEWQRSLQWRGPGQTMDMVTRSFTAKLLAGPTAWWGARAAFAYPLADTLANLQQPILGINPRDDLWEITPRFRALRRQDTLLDMPDYGFGIFEVGGSDLMGPIRDFLDTQPLQQP